MVMTHSYRLKFGKRNGAKDSDNGMGRQHSFGKEIPDKYNYYALKACDNNNFCLISK
jgi:hypothetical protein